jgi:hypothetical protein
MPHNYKPSRRILCQQMLSSCLVVANTAHAQTVGVQRVTWFFHRPPTPVEIAGYELSFGPVTIAHVQVLKWKAFGDHRRPHDPAGRIEAKTLKIISGRPANLEEFNLTGLPNFPRKTPDGYSFANPPRMNNVTCYVMYCLDHAELPMSQGTKGQRGSLWLYLFPLDGTD